MPSGLAQLPENQQNGGSWSKSLYCTGPLATAARIYVYLLVLFLSMISDKVSILCQSKHQSKHLVQPAWPRCFMSRSPRDVSSFPLESHLFFANGLQGRCQFLRGWCPPRKRAKHKALHWTQGEARDIYIYICIQPHTRGKDHRWISGRNWWSTHKFPALYNHGFRHISYIPLPLKADDDG